MGYTGHVVGLGDAEILDLRYDIESTIGKQIEIGFVPNIPEDEQRYTLKDGKVGIGVKGAYIHFVLENKNGVKEFIIDGIKNFEYDVFDKHTKYWVSTSKALLYPIVEGQREFKTQNGDNTYRFVLFIEKNR